MGVSYIGIPTLLAPETQISANKQHFIIGVLVGFCKAKHFEPVHPLYFSLIIWLLPSVHI